MKQRKLDFLSHRPVRATIMIATNANEYLIDKHLPEGYLLNNGVFRFPAGYWESYFVNGKEYNAEGNRSLDEQHELIVKDLTNEGFDQEEIQELMEEIETQEGRQMLLTLDASNKWLRYHPEFEKNALHLLGEVKNEVQSETKNEIRGRIKRRR